MLRKLKFDGYNKKITQVNQAELQRRNGRSQKDDATLLESREKGDQEDGIIWDSIDCEPFEELFEAFKTQVLFRNIVSPHQNAQQPPTRLSQLEARGEDQSNPPAVSDQALSQIEQPVDEEKEGEDTDDREDPFGVWINYLDVYTGSDLDFLNPKIGRAHV